MLNQLHKRILILASIPCIIAFIWYATQALAEVGVKPVTGFALVASICASLPMIALGLTRKYPFMSHRTPSRLVYILTTGQLAALGLSLITITLLGTPLLLFVAAHLGILSTMTLIAILPIPLVIMIGAFTFPHTLRPFSRHATEIEH